MGYDCDNITRQEEFFRSMIILWDHCHIRSPALTKISLCSQCMTSFLKYKVKQTKKQKFFRGSEETG